MKIYKDAGWEPIPGFQLRYIYFLNPAARERLTVPVLPFSKISDMGASMYKGEKITRAKEQDAGSPGAGRRDSDPHAPFASQQANNAENEPFAEVKDGKD